MTRAEMNRRLATMSPELVAQIRRMIAEGYGAAGIALNSPASLKQANAVFTLESFERATAAGLSEYRVFDVEGAGAAQAHVNRALRNA